MSATVTRDKRLYSNGLIVIQATGVLEATIKGTTSSFMKNLPPRTTHAVIKKKPRAFKHNTQRIFRKL